MDTLGCKLLFFVLFVTSVLSHLQYGAEDHQLTIYKKHDESLNNGEKTVALRVKKRVKRGAIYTGLMITQGVISGSFDVYKYVRGCKDYPGFSSNLRKINEKRAVLRNLKNEINLVWSPVIDKKGYFDRLIALVSLLDETIEKFENIQKDIISVLDPNVIFELNQLTNQIQADILKYKAPYAVDVDELTKKFTSTLRFAYRIVSNFQTVAVWMAKKLVAGVGKLVALSSASRAVSANPSAFSRLVTYMGNKKAALSGWTSRKIASYKLSIKTNFKSFVLKNARIRGAWNHYKASPKLQAKWAKVGRGLKLAGKALFLGGALGYDIYMGIKFFDECKRRKEKADVILRNMTAEVNAMLKIKSDTQKLHFEISSNYTELKKQLFTEQLLAFVKNTEEYYENNTQSTNSKSLVLDSITKLRNFRTKINNSDDANTDKLTNGLVIGLSRTNVVLNCVYIKLKALQRGVSDCITGKKSWDEIYNTANTNKEVIDCSDDGNALDKNQFIKAISNEVKAKRYQSICVRNDRDKRQLVCLEWYKDKSVASICNIVKLTTADVNHMIMRCPPGLLGIATITAICIDKVKFSLTQTKTKYYKYNRNQITVEYGKCKLSVTSINVICQMKNDGYEIVDVQKKYGNYKPNDVTTEYNKCALVITPSVSKNICAMKKYFSIDEKIWESYKTKYGSEFFKVYNNCES